MLQMLDILTNQPGIENLEDSWKAAHLQSTMEAQRSWVLKLEKGDSGGSSSRVDELTRKIETSK